MPRGRKKKQPPPIPVQGISPKPAETHANKDASKPSPVIVRERTQKEKDQALGCCAVATAADCVTVKASVSSPTCDFCGEPSTGRIFVYSDGLELRRGYEKDACKKHKKLNGGPMP